MAPAVISVAASDTVSQIYEMVVNPSGTVVRPRPCQSLRSTLCSCALWPGCEEPILLLKLVTPIPAQARVGHPWCVRTLIPWQHRP